MSPSAPAAARSYLDRHGLIAGERVVFTARPHRIELLKPAVLALVALAVAAAAVADARLRALGAVSPVLALLAAPAALRYLSTEYVVTNRRLCVRTGIIRVTTLETVLNKVGTIAVEQTLAGRVLGYGTVVVKGVGGASDELPRIAAPNLLRRKVHEALALG